MFDKPKELVQFGCEQILKSLSLCEFVQTI